MIILGVIAKFLQGSFWYAITITGLVAVEQKVSDNDILLTLWESTPSLVLTGFGILWIVARALKEVSDAWFHHQNNKIDLKQNKERLKQEKIETQKQDQDLND